MAGSLPAPRARRPGFDRAYGIAEGEEGLLAWEWALERLRAARSYWICSTGRDGRPHAMPVWGLWLEDGLWFGTASGSLKARNLRRDPRVVVHLESGDEAVILEGRVEEVRLDARVAEAHERKYGHRFDPDVQDGCTVWLRLAPALAFAWLERDYPGTATRFDF